jgi:multidrug efflux pump subunit AcrA (membrane-fusion protein)
VETEYIAYISWAVGSCTKTLHPATVGIIRNRATSMSIEQSVDAQLIEQTKQQIRSLVAEIAKLSKSEVSPEEFYGEFLPRIVSALAAAGGAVWTVNPDGQLALQYQINLQETRLRESEEHQAQHARLLYKTLAGGEPLLVAPHSGPGEADALDRETPAANPTEFLLVLALLKTDLETVGLVEIFQRAEAGPSTQKGYLRFLVQMCELAGDFLKSHQLRHFSHRQTLWTRLEDFARVVHASLDPRETAYTIANEGRRLIECDRLSVAILKGKKCKIEAISGQDLFDKRSNTVRLLNKLTTAVVQSGDAVWYTGDTRDLPPQVEEAVQEYVDEAHSKTVAVIPLGRPAPPEEDDPKKRVDADAPIGALVVEQIEDSRVAGSLVQRAEVVSRHSSTALANALEHQNLFLMPVWRALGKTRWVLQARTLPKTLSITGAVLLVVLLLVVWPARFTLESKGSLEPVVRQYVFAGIDGVVEELYCVHGEKVPKGKILVKLRNTDLEVAMHEVQGKLSANGAELAASSSILNEAKKLSIEERLRQEGRQAELRQTQASLEAQLKLYEAKKQELDVRSPINGVVVTWDLHNRLANRPVQRGQSLLQVADPDGQWQLELKMPENRMGHIVEAQQVLYDASRKRLDEMLREDARAKLGDAATDEDVQKSADAALTAVPDEKLHDRLLMEFRQRLGSRLETMLGNVADEELKAKLGEVLRESSYDGAWAKLQAILPDVETKDADLCAKLRELSHEELDDQLQVTYILATDPGTTHEGTVKEIHRSAEIRDDEGNTVLIKVAIDKSELPDKRPGATVTAQVYCGQRRLGYVLLHDVIAFIQSRILFRYF